MKRILVMAMLMCVIFLASSAFAEPYYIYDDLNRIIRTTYDNGDYIITDYIGASAHKYKDYFWGNGDIWQKTIEYKQTGYYPGIERKCMWQADPNLAVDGDIVYEEYRDQEHLYPERCRITKTLFDNGDYINTAYFNGMSQIDKQEFYATGGIWQKTFKYDYWNGNYGIHYIDLADVNPSNDGDIVHYEYDGTWMHRLIKQTFDNGNYVTTEYWSNDSGYKHYDRFYDVNGSWQKSVEYTWAGGTIVMLRQWLAFSDSDGCKSYGYTYYDSGNLKEKKAYSDDNWTTLTATYSYSDEPGAFADVVIQHNVTWQGRSYNYNSITIQAGKTLTITGTASSNTPIQGEGTLVVNGSLTVPSIHVGTLTIGSGATLTIAPISGGPLASSAIQALNQENSAIIGINTAQGQIYNAGSIAVSPQMVSQTDNQGLLLNKK